MGAEGKMDDDHGQHYFVNGMPSGKEDQNLLADGSTDYRGQIASRDTTGGWRTGAFILGPETCEKMAVQGMVTNLVPYLTGSFHLSSSYSANMVTTYQGTSYMFTLIGGFIADAYAGRFRVIAASSVILFLGLLILTASVAFPSLKPEECLAAAGETCPAQTGSPLMILYAALYLIALGTGGIKACASPFGADQFDPHHEEEKKNLNGFFSWYFFAITCGAFFAVTVLVYIQEHVGREWGYLFPTVVMLLVLVGFVLARKLYRYKAPKGSPFTLIAKVLVSAFRKRKLPPPADEMELYELSKKDQPRDYLRVKHSNQFKFLDKAAIIVEKSDEAAADSRSPWRLNTMTSVEETKMVIRLLPILITTSLFYTVYAQMTTFSVEQGHTMERKIGRSFEFPAASMAAFLQGAILLTLFSWERAFVPFSRRFTGNKKGVTSLQRIGIGLFISIVTMIVAAAVEEQRMHRVTTDNSQTSESESDPDSVRMSIFWLLPQYILVGSGEALTYAGQLDFFYNESPKAMRSMGAAMCVCTLSIGYYTSSLLVSLVNSITGSTAPDGTVAGAWLPNDINGGKLYSFYWLLAVASTFNFALFLLCAHWYKNKAEADRLEELDGSMEEISGARYGYGGQLDESKSENVNLGEGKFPQQAPDESPAAAAKHVFQLLPPPPAAAVAVITSNGSRDSSTHQQKLLLLMQRLDHEAAASLQGSGPVESAANVKTSNNPRSKSMDCVPVELDELPHHHRAVTTIGSIREPVNLELVPPFHKRKQSISTGKTTTTTVPPPPPLSINQ